MVDVKGMLEETDVRAILSAVLVIGLLAMQFIQGTVPAEYVTLVGMSVAYYFGNK
jgi:hypothetical protein